MSRTHAHPCSADDRSERGATIVFVAVSLSMLCIMAGLALDLGQWWVERRALITASDAAALAAGHVFADGGPGCAEAAHYVATNAPQADSHTCTPAVAGATGGTVQVGVFDSIDYRFAPAFGFDSGPTSSHTSVAWGLDLAPGIRPFAFCDKTTPEFTAWLAAATTDDDPELYETFRFPFGNSGSLHACATGHTGSGNWGFIDFDSGANGIPPTLEWIRNGYDDGLITTSTTTHCGIDPTGCYPGTPGSISGAHRQELEALKDSGQAFGVPVYTRVDYQGSNAMLKIVKIPYVRIVRFKVTGPQQSRFIEIEAFHLLQDGEPDKTVEICSVGPEPC